MKTVTLQITLIIQIPILVSLTFPLQSSNYMLLDKTFLTSLIYEIYSGKMSLLLTPKTSEVKFISGTTMATSTA